MGHKLHVLGKGEGVGVVFDVDAVAISPIEESVVAVGIVPGRCGDGDVAAFGEETAAADGTRIFRFSRDVYGVEVEVFFLHIKADLVLLVQDGARVVVGCQRLIVGAVAVDADGLARSVESIEING